MSNFRAMKCVTHKRCYASQEIAEDALIEARTAYDYTRGNGPVGVYRCDDCGYYHLTSKGPENTRLSASRESGEINRQKEANWWLDKFKNRG